MKRIANFIVLGLILCLSSASKAQTPDPIARAQQGVAQASAKVERIDSIIDASEHSTREGKSMAKEAKAELKLLKRTSKSLNKQYSRDVSTYQSLLKSSDREDRAEAKDALRDINMEYKKALKEWKTAQKEATKALNLGVKMTEKGKNTLKKSKQAKKIAHQKVKKQRLNSNIP
jgi:hypothetical protein